MDLPDFKPLVAYRFPKTIFDIQHRTSWRSLTALCNQYLQHFRITFGHDTDRLVIIISDKTRQAELSGQIPDPKAITNSLYPT